MACNVGLVKQGEARHQAGRNIERFPDLGVLPMSAVGVGCVEEGVVTDHVSAHIVRLFEYLGPNVCEESVRGPASKDHELVDWVVVEEERHGVACLQGVSPNVFWIKSKGFLAAAGFASLPDLAK